MTNYDVNRDQNLDNSEAEKLWRDVQSYNYAGINVVDVNETKAWIARFDTNKDGKITVGELVNAIKAEGPVSFQALSEPEPPSAVPAESVAVPAESEAVPAESVAIPA